MKTALKALSLASALAALLLVSGCSSVVGVAPSTIPITEKDSYTIIGPAKGTASGVVWFLFPTFPNSPSKEAREAALKSRDADALIEVTEEYNTFSFIVISFAWTTVEGTAVKVKRGGREATE